MQATFIHADIFSSIRAPSGATDIGIRVSLDFWEKTNKLGKRTRFDRSDAFETTTSAPSQEHNTKHSSQSTLTLHTYSIQSHFRNLPGKNRLFLFFFPQNRRKYRDTTSVTKARECYIAKLPLEFVENLHYFRGIPATE